MAKKGGLGRGMDALFMDNSAVGDTNSTVTLNINEIDLTVTSPDRFLMRKALQNLQNPLKKMA